MDKKNLTAKHLLPAFIILYMLALMAWRGEVAWVRGLRAETGGGGGAGSDARLVLVDQYGYWIG